MIEMVVERDKKELIRRYGTNFTNLMRGISVYDEGPIPIGRIGKVVEEDGKVKVHLEIHDGYINFRCKAGEYPEHVVEVWNMEDNQEKIFIDKDDVINLIEKLKEEIKPITDSESENGLLRYYDGMFNGYNRVIKEIKKEYPSDNDLILKWLGIAESLYRHEFGTVTIYRGEELKELEDLITRLEK